MDVVHVDLNIASAMCMHIEINIEAGVVEIKQEHVCTQLSWWLTAMTAIMLDTQSSLTESAQEACGVIDMRILKISSPAGVELEEVEDFTNFDLRQIEKKNAEMEAKLAAYRSAPSPEPTTSPSVQEQPESVGAAAQADVTTSSQPRMATSVASTHVCTLGDDTDTASDSLFPALHDEVCFDHQPGTPAAPPGVDCHSLSHDQLDQQPPQLQQGPSSSERPRQPLKFARARSDAASSSARRSVQRKLASTFSGFIRRSGGTTKTKQTDKALAKHAVDKSNVLADAQSQPSVSSFKDHIALTADASLQHSAQSGIRPSTAVTPIVGSLLSQAACPVATAQHPVYSRTPPSLLWQTSAEDARAFSTITVTDVPQLLGETGTPSPGSQRVYGERSESARVQPSFTHDEREQHTDLPSNRYS